jgi:hypothetical protein
LSSRNLGNSLKLFSCSKIPAIQPCFAGQHPSQLANPALRGEVCPRLDTKNPCPCGTQFVCAQESPVSTRKVVQEVLWFWAVLRSDSLASSLSNLSNFSRPETRGERALRPGERFGRGLKGPAKRRYGYFYLLPLNYFPRCPKTSARQATCVVQHGNTYTSNPGGQHNP